MALYVHWHSAHPAQYDTIILGLVTFFTCRTKCPLIGYELIIIKEYYNVNAGVDQCV